MSDMSSIKFYIAGDGKPRFFLDGYTYKEDRKEKYVTEWRCVKNCHGRARSVRNVNGRLAAAQKTADHDNCVPEDRPEIEQSPKPATGTQETTDGTTYRTQSKTQSPKPATSTQETTDGTTYRTQSKTQMNMKIFTENGKQRLYFDGYTYKQDKITADVVYWKCIEQSSGCHGRAKSVRNTDGTLADSSVTVRHDLCHPVDRSGKQQAGSKCAFCGHGANEKICGKLYVALLRRREIAAHHKCMLYSPKLTQNCLDDEFGGFDVKAVKEEIKRGKTLKCCYCKRKIATAGCEVRKCKKSFHYPCAKKSQSSSTVRWEDSSHKVHCWIFCNEKHKKEKLDGLAGNHLESDCGSDEESHDSTRPKKSRKKALVLESSNDSSPVEDDSSMDSNPTVITDPESNDNSNSMLVSNERKRRHDFAEPDTTQPAKIDRSSLDDDERIHFVDEDQSQYEESRENSSISDYHTISLPNVSSSEGAGIDSKSQSSTKPEADKNAQTQEQGTVDVEDQGCTEVDGQCSITSREQGNTELEDEVKDKQKKQMRFESNHNRIDEANCQVSVNKEQEQGRVSPEHPSSTEPEDTANDQATSGQGVNSYDLDCLNSNSCTSQDNTDCLLVIPEDSDNFEEESVRRKMAQQFNSREEHVHTWTALHPVLVVSFCMQHYFYDLVVTMKDQQWDQFEDLLLNASTIQDKLDAYRKVNDTRPKLLQEYRKTESFIQKCLHEAAGTFECNYNDCYLCIVINDISDPHYRIREALHHTAIYHWENNQVSLKPFSNLSVSQHHDYQRLECSVLYNWLKKSSCKDSATVLYLPEEGLLKLTSNDVEELAFQDLKSKFISQGSGSDPETKVIFIDKINGSLLHFRNYTQAYLDQFISSGTLCVTCVFPFKNMTGEGSFLSFSPYLELSHPDYRVRYISAFNPSKKPVTVLIAEVKKDSSHHPDC